MKALNNLYFMWKRDTLETDVSFVHEFSGHDPLAVTQTGMFFCLNFYYLNVIHIRSLWKYFTEKLA